MLTCIMCFTETFLKLHQDIGGEFLLNTEHLEVFRLDGAATGIQDLSNGGITIARATSLLPQSTL